MANALLLLTAGALTHWRMLSPGFALALMQTNLVLLAFNLLPALPLDGGRIAYALLSVKLKRERRWKSASGQAARWRQCCCLPAPPSRPEWRRVNLSFLFAAVFIWASAADERQALSDARMKAVLGALRPIDRPVPARVWPWAPIAPPGTALRATLYAVYKDDRLSSITDDRQLVKAALTRGLGVKVGEVGNY